MTDADVREQVYELAMRRVREMLPTAQNNALALLDRLPGKLRDAKHIEAAVHTAVGLCLIKLGEDLSADKIVQAMHMHHPDEAEKVARMEVCGINREQDYVWARTKNPQRGASGLVLPTEMMRFNGIDSLLGTDLPEKWD